MTSIIFTNQKGGVSKTSSTCAMAAALKRRGYRVLAIDMDPQGNLSDHVGAETEKSMTVYELLRKEATPEDVIQHLDAFDIIPAAQDLALAEVEIVQTGKEYRLREVLEPIKDAYDFVLVDTSTYLGTLTVMALSYADEAIIPTNAQYFSLKGINTLKKTIDDVKKYTNPNIKIIGVLMTAFNKQTNLSKKMNETAEKLCETFQTPLFETHIRVAKAMGESQSEGVDVFSYDAKSTAARDYEAFTAEYLKMKGEIK